MPAPNRIATRPPISSRRPRKRSSATSNATTQSDQPLANKRPKRVPIEQPPKWETTRFFNEGKNKPASLPTINRDGAVARKPRSKVPPKFLARTLSRPTSSQSSTPSSAPQKTPSQPPQKTTGNRPPTILPKPQQAVAANDPKKRARIGAATSASKTLTLNQAKSNMAALASALVANPQGKVENLSALRSMAVAHKGRITALVIVTESQVYKDLAPAYRIRPITNKEAEVKVSKHVAQLRTFENSLLSSYLRFVRSCVSSSRFRAAGNASTPAAKDMMLVRHAACQALASLIQTLPHFNSADLLSQTVCGLVTDHDPKIRTVCAQALTQLLSEAHKSSGHTLDTCVLVAKTLSSITASKPRAVSVEVVEPLSEIHFAGFAKLPPSRKDANAPKKGKRFNHKRTNREKLRQDRNGPKDEGDDVERDMAEGEADATPQEMHATRKALLDAVCNACFNVVKAASVDALDDVKKGNKVATKKPRRPPPALSAALRGLLRVARYISADVVEAIVAALIPILRASRFPLIVRFRTLSATYAILGLQARASADGEDSVASDSRAVDSALYAAIGALYGPEVRMGEEENVTFEAMEAVVACRMFHKMPAGRAAAFARRLSSMAVSGAPTHTCALGLLKVAQGLLEVPLVSAIFPQDGDQGGNGCGVDASVLEEFDLTAVEPDTANAGRSAAWELACLVKYFHPVVRGLSETCVDGVCGAALPRGSENVVMVAKEHSSDVMGFNPAPVEEWKGKTSKGQIRVWEDGMRDKVLGQVFDEEDERRSFLVGEGDSAAVERFFEGLWTGDEVDEVDEVDFE